MRYLLGAVRVHGKQALAGGVGALLSRLPTFCRTEPLILTCIMGGVKPSKGSMSGKATAADGLAIALHTLITGAR